MDQTDTQSSKPKQADSEGETHSFLFGSHAWQNRSDKPTWCYLPSTAVQTRNVTEWPGEHSEASSALKSSIFFLVERLQTHCDVCCLFVDYCFEVWHYCLYFLKPRPQVGNRGNKSREKKGDFLISSHEIRLLILILKPGEVTPSCSRHFLSTFRKTLSTFFRVNGGDQKILKEREIWSFNHRVVRNNTKSEC